jgi:pentatricopeptide repeat protein
MIFSLFTTEIFSRIFDLDDILIFYPLLGAWLFYMYISKQKKIKSRTNTYRIPQGKSAKYHPGRQNSGTQSPYGSQRSGISVLSTASNSDRCPNSPSASASESASPMGAKSVLFLLLDAVANRGSTATRQRASGIRRRLMHDDVNPTSTHFKVLSFAVEEGCVEEAVKAAGELLNITENNYQREFTKIMMLLRKGGNWELALELFSKYRHQVDNRIPYNVALGVYHTNNMWAEAMDMLRTLPQEIVPTAPDVSMALDTVARAGRWQQTLEMYDELLNQGTATSISTYTVVFRACLETDDIARANMYLERMEHEGVECNAFISRAMRALAKKENLLRTSIWGQQKSRGAGNPKFQQRTSRSDSNSTWAGRSSWSSTTQPSPKFQELSWQPPQPQPYAQQRFVQ